MNWKASASIEPAADFLDAVGLAGCFVVLLILWLFEPGWRVTKILGIISNALLLLSMLLSYRAEEKMKKKDKE